MGIIEEYRGQVENIPNNDSSQIETDIDVFKDDNDKDGIIDAVESISNYWNESVKKLLDAFNDFFSVNGLNTVEDNAPYDAGHSFKNEPYVNPWNNNDNKTYIEVRTDEIKSVLEKKENLDFTRSQIEGCITRLLMPQYARRIEIEDLNRNFWVISQNLEALNKFISELSLDWADELIAELMGIWNNIYKLWEALIVIEEKYNNIVSNEKVRWIFDYGFGQYNNAQWAAYLIRNDKNEIWGLDDDGVPIHESLGRDVNLGILPYIKRTTINSADTNENIDFQVLHVHYNERFNQILTSNGIKTEALKDSIVQMDNKDTRRDIAQMIKAMKQRNYCLVSVPESGGQSIYSLNSPIQTALDFYRRYLYWIDNPDNSVSSSLAGYFSSENKGSTEYKILENGISNGALAEKLALLGYTRWDNIDEYISLGKNNSTTDWGTPEQLSENSLIDINIFRCFHFLIYYLTYVCGRSDKELLQMPFYAALCKVESEDSSEYTVARLKYYLDKAGSKAAQQTLIYNYIYLVNQFKIEEYEQKGCLLYLGNNIKWNLWSYMDENILNNEDEKSSSLGRYCFASFSNDNYDDHLWLDFVNHIYESNDYYESSYSQIKSVTLINQVGTIGKKWLYDWNISFPVSKTGNVKYEDFVRLNKPLPYLSVLRQGESTEENWYRERLNGIDYYISEKSSSNVSSVVDGFILTQSDYNNILPEDRVLNEVDGNLLMGDNLVHFNVATSDMIDCKHTEDATGQSRLINLHGFDNPTVNLRYINGRTKNQEIEIITTKDSSKQEEITDEKIEDSLIFKTIILDTNEAEVDLQMASDGTIYTIGAKPSGYDESSDSYTGTYTFNSVEAQYIPTAHSDKKIITYFLRQKLQFDKDVVGGYHINQATDSWGTFNTAIDELLKNKKDQWTFVNYLECATGETKEQDQKEYIIRNKLSNALDNNTTYQLFLIVQRIKNYSSSQNRASNASFQEAGIYIPYLCLYNKNLNSYNWIKINRMICPGTVCPQCAANSNLSPAASNIFVQTENKYYGHAGCKKGSNKTWEIKFEGEANGTAWNNGDIIATVCLYLVGNNEIDNNSSTGTDRYCKMSLDFKKVGNNYEISAPQLDWTIGSPHNPMNGTNAVINYGSDN